ncbi:MAG: hypothetical protein NTY41_11190 [Proteobacteria bacterium]|nr:hypothetical protein [Pseudomonadota bacterium]
MNYDNNFYFVSNGKTIGQRPGGNTLIELAVKVEAAMAWQKEKANRVVKCWIRGVMKTAPISDLLAINLRKMATEEAAKNVDTIANEIMQKAMAEHESQFALSHDAPAAESFLSDEDLEMARMNAMIEAF